MEFRVGSNVVAMTLIVCFTVLVGLGYNHLIVNVLIVIALAHFGIDLTVNRRVLKRILKHIEDSS